MSLWGFRRLYGNQLRNRLLRWLLPSDLSINHSIACEAYYRGAAQWFFKGNIFNQWKPAGSFLWKHGKRGLLWTFIMRWPLIVSHFYSQFGKKCALIRPSSTFFPYGTNICQFSISIIEDIKALHDTGRAQWPIFISTSGTLTNKTSFCLSSSNSLLGLIHVVTYSHNSIFRTRSWSTET